MKKFLTLCLTFSLFVSADEKEIIQKRVAEKKQTLIAASDQHQSNALYIKINHKNGKDEFVKIDKDIVITHKHTYEIGEKALILSLASLGGACLIILPIAVVLTVSYVSR
jgi:hypothetical protein